MAIPPQLQVPMQSQAMAILPQLQVPMQSQAMAVLLQLQVSMQSQAMAILLQLQVSMQSQAMAIPQQLQVPVQSQAMAIPQQLQVPTQSQTMPVPQQLQVPSQPQVMAVPYQPQPQHIVFLQMQPQTPVAASPLQSQGLAGYTIPGTLPPLVQPLINMPLTTVPYHLQRVASSTCQSVPVSYGSLTPLQQTATQGLPGHLPNLAQVRQASQPQQYNNSTATAFAGIEPRAPVNNLHRTSIKGKSIHIFWPDELVHKSGVFDIDQDEKSSCNQHMIDLKILAKQFQWDKVRYHEVLLSMIQQGRRQ